MERVLSHKQHHYRPNRIRSKCALESSTLTLPRTIRRNHIKDTDIIDEHLHATILKKLVSYNRSNTHEWRSHVHTLADGTPLTQCNVTLAELKCLLCLFILMGREPMPRESDVWSTRPCTDPTQQQVFACMREAFSRGRYQVIRRNLRLQPLSCNEYGMAKESADWLLEAVLCQTRGMFTPGPYVALDDASIKCSAQCPVSRRNRSKKADEDAIPYLAVASPEGITLAMTTHIKATYDRLNHLTHHTTPNETKDAQLRHMLTEAQYTTYRFITHTLSNCPNTSIVSDSEFTSYPLFHHLRRAGITALGTARHNLKEYAPKLRDERVNSNLKRHKCKSV